MWWLRGLARPVLAGPRPENPTCSAALCTRGMMARRARFLPPETPSSATSCRHDPADHCHLRPLLLGEEELSPGYMPQDIKLVGVALQACAGDLAASRNVLCSCGFHGVSARFRQSTACTVPSPRPSQLARLITGRASLAQRRSQNLRDRVRVISRPSPLMQPTEASQVAA